MFGKFLTDESGVAVIEYTLIAALIAVITIAAMQFVAEEIGITFNYIDSTLENSTDSGGDSSGSGGKQPRITPAQHEQPAQVWGGFGY